MQQQHQQKRRHSWPGGLRLVAGAAVLGASYLAYAAAPAAGSIIGNQASATYQDAGGVTRTATSNVVQTLVQQVAGLTLSADGQKYTAPGAQVAYPHTLTNSGNGTDSFTLSLANFASGDKNESGTADNTADNFDYTNLHIYVDANGDGNPDNFSDLNNTSVSVARGGVYKFVVVGNIPGSASNGQNGKLTVKATSTTDNTKSASNIDKSTVSSNAVVSVLKSMSVTRAQAGTTGVTVTLAYTNTGNDTATDVTLNDTLQSPGFTYVAGSGKWSVSGASALSDASDGNEAANAGIQFHYTAGTKTVTAKVASVPAGVSGTLTFTVNIDSNLAPQTLLNSALFTFDPDGPGVIPPTSPTPTNVVTIIIDPTAAVTVKDTGVADAGAGTDTDGAINELAKVATVAEGDTAKFLNVVTNTGSGTDSYNITIAALGGAEDFPAGTTFILYKSDGLTPLTDSNGDGTPDTGPVAARASYNIVVKAILPPNASHATDASSNGYRSTLTARSVNEPGVTDTVVNKINTITGSTVDLTNVAAAGTAGALGEGAGPEAAAVQTNTVTPSNVTNTTAFVLWVKNTSSIGDSYSLLADKDGTFGSSNDLRSGWTVKFYKDSNGVDDGVAGELDSDTVEVTNTGALTPDSAVMVWAVVTVPKNFAAGTYNLYFRAYSPASQALDIKRDAVTVNTLRAIQVTPNNAGQVYPGGSVVYQHAVTNSGNAVETAVTLATADNKSAEGWTSVVYEDTDGSGSLGAGDAVITSLANLAAGSSRTIFVKVYAPAGSLEGAVNSTTLTADATATGGNSSQAQDSTTVIIGDVALSKEQALDADCDGTADGSYVTVSLNAAPGACLLYHVLANNSGVGSVTNVVIDDSTPSFTTYMEDAAASGMCKTGASTSMGTIASKPANGAAGVVKANLGTMAPGTTADVRFCVKIDQ